MTFIQPNNKYGVIDIALGICILFTIAGVIWLIVLYNQTVDFTHKITEMRESIQKLEGESAELKERTFAFFDSAQVQTLASEHGLIPDRNPRYVEFKNQWAFVSRFSQ